MMLGVHTDGQACRQAGRHRQAIGLAGTGNNNNTILYK